MYLFLPINAQPWAMGDVSVGRKNGGLIPIVSPNATLKGFQEAVREHLEGTEKLPSGQQYQLRFYIWRQIESYTTIATDRKVVKNQADATNLQKGLEDALQGVLFENDRDVADVRTVIVEQSRDTKPMIVIHADIFQDFNPDELPQHVWDTIDENSMTLFDMPTKTDEVYDTNPEEIF